MSQFFEIRVGKESNPQRVADSILANITQERILNVYFIGAEACMTTNRAVTIAQDMLVVRGIELHCRFTKETVQTPQGDEKTAHKWILKGEQIGFRY